MSGVALANCAADGTCNLCIYLGIEGNRNDFSVDTYVNTKWTPLNAFTTIVTSNDSTDLVLSGLASQGSKTNINITAAKIKAVYIGKS